MPVSLRRAKFLPSGERETNMNNIPALTPSLPVWVVVHGMNSSESELKIKEMTKALAMHPAMKDVQIVTVDWADAAVSSSSTGTNAPWTKGVGAWLASQLLSVGFQPEQISGAGHSHGTYVLWSMGQALIDRMPGHQMDTLVALDPAGNPPWTGFDHSKINFANVSQRSAAFEIAWLADNNNLASTADITFKIDAPTEWRPSIEHSLGMTLFTNQLSMERRSDNVFSDHFGLEKIRALNASDIRAYQANKYSGIAEGYVPVDVDWITINGERFPLTSPDAISFWKPGEQTETVIPSNLFVP